MTQAAPGTITLMGSGELTRSMSPVHRGIVARIPPPVRGVFLDTPAGFELNAADIAARACDYVSHYVGIPITVASFPSAARATEAEVRAIVAQLERAGYIFAGPGSPTYAVRNWRDTPVFEAVARRVAEGAHLVLASAAAIAVGRYALPVYEVYKVGEDPHWVDGLDLPGRFGLELAIVTHWNNAEGEGYDTRFCFMGAPRFEALERELPDSTTILGIDEYTACIIDPAAGLCRVMGAGGVTLRRHGRERVIPTGEGFGLDELRSATGRELSPASPEAGEAGEALARTRQALVDQTGDAEEAAARAQADPVDAAGRAYELTLAVERALSAGVEPTLVESAQTALRRLLVAETEAVDSGSGEAGETAALVGLLLEVRRELRAARNFALADEIRDRLARLGIIVEDRPEGAAWRRAPAAEANGHT